MPEDTPEVQATPDATDESGPSEAPAPATESSDAEAQPATDYQKRYEDLRPQYDRTTAELNQFKEFYQNLNNPETAAQALAALGYNLDGDEEDDEDDYIDPEEEIAQIKQYLFEENEARKEEEVSDLEQEFMETSLSKLPKGLSQDEKDIIGALAYQLEDEDGLPDVQAAHEYMQKAEEAARQRYVESKKAPRVDLGVEGDEKIDMNDDEVRAQFLADALEAGEE